MKKAGMVVAASCLFLLACGDEDVDEPSLEGRWGSEVGGLECVTVMAFQGDEYESDLICELENGSVAIDAEVGTFVAEAGVITFTPTATSCGSQRPATVETFGFEFVGESLRLVSPSAGVVVLLERIEDEGGGGAGTAAYGCFDEQGVFTPMSVNPVTPT